MSIEVHPLTAARWPDLEAVMGERGGSGGCWCMLWRLPAKAWEAGKGAPNRAALRERASQDPPPGLVAYLDSVPSGWISVAKRDEFPRLDASRVMARVDDAPVWSVTCFLVKAGARGKGVAGALLDAACDFVAAQGSEWIEGYPVDPLGGRYAAGFAWTGLKSVFDRSGFTEVARRSEKRPIMRKHLGRVAT